MLEQVPQNMTKEIVYLLEKGQSASLISTILNLPYKTVLEIKSKALDTAH